MAAKHHYVPQFYLNGFTDSNSGNLKNPYLWITDLDEQTVEKRSPKNTASLTGYYDLNNVNIGEDKSKLEKILSAIESNASSVIRRIRLNNFQLTIDARFNLANYIGLQ